MVLCVKDISKILKDGWKSFKVVENTLFEEPKDGEKLWYGTYDEENGEIIDDEFTYPFEPSLIFYNGIYVVEIKRVKAQEEYDFDDLFYHEEFDQYSVEVYNSSPPYHSSTTKYFVSLSEVLAYAVIQMELMDRYNRRFDAEKEIEVTIDLLKARILTVC